MKNFLYLIQGRSDLIKNYSNLVNRDNADAIFLTYDKQIDEAIFFPNSTWAQGRNKMLEIALEREDYLYYIFGDDDIAFKKGGWGEFEENLMVLKPAIAVPVFLEKTKKTPLRWLKYHSFLFNDEQMIAFHNEVIKDGIIIPYQNQFHDIHWWASCEIQQILIQNFYSADSIQLNKIHITNECRLRYPNPDIGRNTFEKLIREWLAKQFIGNYKDISMSVKKSFPVILWRTFIYFIRHCCNFKTQNYSVSENTIKKILSNESEILNQYLKYLKKYSSN